MKCPICGKPATPEHKPFCSRRCAEIDLGRWLNDSYALPPRRSKRMRSRSRASSL
ncbi:DNA gyrase inhibitor YacG [Acidocella sp. MX-AZ03]|uniref:DNA gyrase inhibitor YacG n=1 Tax=Acidocella sp. MX-AZ03 TaxID=2697363 RepID=UPI0022DE3FBD|nr:DNA gyrase inhibitor YacG [Acidocella sp. MX-AZ03]WBO60766.1 DNA gyrase inhibitor YacG [Acidocella sp. MX-AZ03]